MMRSGEYWIGDLCYCLGDVWDEVCALTLTDEGVEGEFNLSDGRRFALFSTKFGDGDGYEVSTGDTLSVDSGSIGCVRTCDITDVHARLELGIITQFDTAFAVSSGDGFISIGGIEIDTGTLYSEEFYWDREDDDD